ncbi:nucleolar protein 6 [Phlebotomus argentipes]|uniref:nucleolar protein 6 n=1 Tax=Phlebotomus argentipes TaxID=94469 RepID=UPI0028931523|nr:nucleolar protein 6 [Phlebotomus argentipes]
MKRKNFVSLKEVTVSESDSDSGNDLEMLENSDSDGDLDPELSRPTAKGSSRPKYAKLEHKTFSVAEINELKEVGNLYHSNLFKMQTEEMLKEVKILQNKHKSYIEDWVLKFNALLKKLPSGKEKHSLSDASWRGNIKLSLDTSFLEETKGAFQFVAPKKPAQIVGSQSLGTILGNHFNVDVCIEVPKEFYKADDNLNMIYHRKRGLYLCYILKHLQDECPELATVREFMYSRGDPLKPILLLSNPGKNKHVTFAIRLSCEVNTYKLTRFIPQRNNVRPNIIKGMPENVQTDQCPTPHYNSSILEDFLLLRNEKYIASALGDRQNIRDGVILLKIWLKQRQLDRGYCGFSGYLATILVAYLIQSRKMTQNVSSYQLVRIVWTFLANSEWNELGKGLCLLVKEDEGQNQPKMDEFHKFFDVVMTDSSGFLNLCYNMSQDVYKRVKLEAKIALNILDNSSVNRFQCLFMSTIPSFLQYDQILNITVDEAVKEALQRSSSHADILDYCTFWYPRLLKMILEIVRKGLSNRVISLCPLALKEAKWSANEDPQPVNNSATLSIGLIVNPKEALDVVVKGPQANEPEALEFRSFWGEKSQLRRFKDGSITEACVWAPSSSSLTRKRMICRDIVRHLLSHHLEVSEESVGKFCTYVGNQLNCEIPASESSKGGKYRDGYDTEMMSLHVIQEFDALGKILRSLEDLPLEITGVQGTSAVFRYCDPIENFPNGYCVSHEGWKIFYGKQIYDGVLQLSVSGKWPDDVDAIGKLKQAFYLELAKKLTKSGVKFSRVSGNAIEILKEGFIFRFKLAHTKELMLRKQVLINGISKQRDSPESVQFEKELFILPRLSSALNGIHQQFNSFGPTVCLAKRWLYWQLFDQHLWPDECTELLVASLFTKGGAFLPAFQPQVGFLRFLHLIAYTNWQSEMIIVNFNESLSQEEISKMEGNFLSSRDNFPPLTIVTSFDSSKHSIWSKSAPILQVLVRVSLLAKQMLDSVENDLVSGVLEVEKLFRQHQFDSFDVVIKIDAGNVNFEAQNATKEMQKKRLPVEFSPAKRFLEDLRSAFGSVALFFANPLKEDVIGVFWKPNIGDRTDFRISTLNGHTTKSDGQIQLHTEKIVRDFEIMGEGLELEIIRKR